MAAVDDECCVICLGEKRSPVQVNCGHSFCHECLEAHKSASQGKNWANKCPICRTEMWRCAQPIVNMFSSESGSSDDERGLEYSSDGEMNITYEEHPDNHIPTDEHVDVFVLVDDDQEEIDAISELDDVSSVNSINNVSELYDDDLVDDASVLNDVLELDDTTDDDLQQINDSLETDDD
ncbi:uncharacterized protein LOC106091507 [Stomoxys calcitrans]|uniref:RING-type domain-containing protein n=1 Tax=Stomoxys calcitrans TaxID=35570 RepID=A0A1I8PRU3_STOCA|nr:uncharacterized protein LOC106091507 [Stomoxys calcitrans]